MFWYKEREQILKKAIEVFMDKTIGIIDDRDIGYFISIFHYSLMLGAYIVLFLTNNIVVFSFVFSVVFIQLLLNIVDDGCILIKLERKYLGKEWFGIYTVIGDLLGIDMNVTMTKRIYYTITCVCLWFGLINGIKILIKLLKKIMNTTISIIKKPRMLKCLIIRIAFIVEWFAGKIIDTLT